MLCTVVLLSDVLLSDVKLAMIGNSIDAVSNEAFRKGAYSLIIIREFTFSVDFSLEIYSNCFGLSAF